MLSLREYAAQTIQSWWKKTNLHRKLAKPSRVLGRKGGRDSICGGHGSIGAKRGSIGSKRGSIGSKRGSLGSKRGSIGGGRGSIGSNTQESLSIREAATIIQRVWRRHNVRH